MNTEQAEITAIQALSWLAQNDEKLENFLNVSGAAPGDLRERAQEPEFLGFVLDFILQDDATILDFTESQNIPPEAVQQARMALGGGLPNWT